MGKPRFFVSLAEKCEPDLILPFRLLKKIRNLSKPIIIFNRSNTKYDFLKLVSRINFNNENWHNGTAVWSAAEAR
jgi:hypothetical protein